MRTLLALLVVLVAVGSVSAGDLNQDRQRSAQRADEAKARSTSEACASCECPSAYSRARMAAQPQNEESNRRTAEESESATVKTNKDAVHHWIYE